MLRRRRHSIATTIGAVGISATLLSVHLIRGEPNVDVVTNAVTAGPIARRVVTSGVIEPRYVVSVAAQAAGTLETIEVTERAWVRNGQVIARLASSALRERQTEAQMSLAAARAEQRSRQDAFDDTEVKLSRAEALSARQLLAAADLDAARSAVAQARADLAAADVGLSEAQSDVDRATADLRATVIRSPVDGVITLVNAMAGQGVEPGGMALFRISTDIHAMRVAAVDDPDAGNVRAGEAVTVRVLERPGELFRGVVAEVSPLLIDVADIEGKLQTGMAATIEFDDARTREVVRIPNRAIEFRPSPQLLSAIDQGPVPPSSGSRAERTAQVWQYDGTGLTPVTVRAGSSDDEWTELVSGPLRPGDALVTSASPHARGD